MIKRDSIIFPLIFIILCSSCSNKTERTASKIDDDYVLVEFASKLEEDFHKINNQPSETNEDLNDQHP